MSLDLLLVVFSNFAVASSFLGVTLGLFDYLADLFGFDDSAVGRLKTALLTFARLLWVVCCSRTDSCTPLVMLV